MKIKFVEYTRLVSFGNYQNETIGATATVGMFEDAEDAFEQVKAWVDRRCMDSQIVRNQVDYDREESQSLRDDIRQLRQEREAIETALVYARKEWEIVKSFFEKNGLALPQCIEEDIPF